jgi:mRNA-degrading endonuclease RelE of RelBE toxin-antitoxin system
MWKSFIGVSSNRSVDVRPHLEKILEMLYEKDPVTYWMILRKMREIVLSKDINHYKNLRAPLQQLKRVHIRKSFVLTFRAEGDMIRFYDFDHHDRIYEK